jgi:hypothetical protein
MLIPVYGFLQGDALGLVVLMRDDETADDFANKLMQAAEMRVPPFSNRAVYFNGQRLEAQAILAKVGVTPLDRLDVLVVDPDPMEQKGQPG